MGVRPLDSWPCWCQRAPHALLDAARSSVTPGGSGGNSGREHVCEGFTSIPPQSLHVLAPISPSPRSRFSMFIQRLLPCQPVPHHPFTQRARRSGPHAPPASHHSQWSVGSVHPEGTAGIAAHFHSHALSSQCSPKAELSRKGRISLSVHEAIPARTWV